MKDHLLSLAAATPDPRARLNVVREYLQAHVLRSLQDAGAFASLAFLGGTALRFLHGLRRYSERLDFSLEIPEREKGLADLMREVKRDCEAAGYHVQVPLRTGRAVQSALLRFEGILLETGLSAMRAEKLMVRVEVGTRPPAGASLQTRLVTRHFPIVFRAHDLPSCMAGKIHALLARRYTKGRDLFDLAWYLTHPARPSPNLPLLNNALAQTGRGGREIVEKNWRKVVRARVASLDWPAVVRDVEPFLEDPRDLRLLEKDLILGELG